MTHFWPHAVDAVVHHYTGAKPLLIPCATDPFSIILSSFIEFCMNFNFMFYSQLVVCHLCHLFFHCQSAFVGASCCYLSEILHHIYPLNIPYFLC